MTIEHHGTPRDTDDVPVNLERPIPESGPGVVYGQFDTRSA